MDYGAKILIFAEIDFYIPVFEFHGAILLQIEVHLESTIPHLRLMPNLTLEAIGFGNVEILGQLCLVIRVCALLDDLSGALLGSQSAQVGQTLFGDDAVEIVFCVVDVRAVRHDTGDTVRVGLGRT